MSKVNDPLRTTLVRFFTGALRAGLILTLIAALGPLALADKNESSSKGGHGGGGGGTGGGTGTATYSGDAAVLKASILGIQTTLSEAGPLASTGGAAEASLLNSSILGLINAEALHAATIGQADRTRSEASVAALNLTVTNTVTIGAGLVMSRALATCSAASGLSDIVALSINGKSIRISGSPNQTVNLLLAKVVINEQVLTPGGITVNALHVTVLNDLGVSVADVVVSSAHADIECSSPTNPPPCQGGDFITGGGFITGTPTGAKANFGVAGGLKQDDTLWGHLTYIDHGTGMKVKGTSITGYHVVNSTTRIIDGTADVDGTSATYVVTVADNGEPGTSDTFELQLSTGYTSNGTLGGGNIQLHMPCK